MKENKTVELQRKILSDNIRRLLHAKGKTQTDMARDLNLSETTVSSWMKGDRYPRLDKIQLMADYFGVLRSAITEEDQESVIRETKSQYNYLPRSISAGLPDNVDPIIGSDIEKISIPDAIMGKWAGSKDVYMMRVNGESMNRIIPHGSLIAVKQIGVENLKDGDIVVYSDGNDYSVKRLYRHDDQLIFRPDSTDPRFTDYVSSADNTNLKIHGKVVVYIVELD